MKQKIKMLCLALVGLLAAVTFAEGTGSRWELSDDKKTLTDNTLGNTFTVDVTGDRLTIKGWNTKNEEGKVDLSSLNGRDSAYKLVSLGGGNDVFRMTGITELSLPDTLESLSGAGYGLFERCSSLTTVTPFLPRSLKSITKFVFQDCPNLTGDLCIASDDRNFTIGSGSDSSNYKTFQGNKMGNAYFVNYSGGFPKHAFACPNLTNMYFIGKMPSHTSFHVDAFKSGNDSSYTLTTPPRFFFSESDVVAFDNAHIPGFTEVFQGSESETLYDGAEPVGVFVENNRRHLVYAWDPLSQPGLVVVASSGEELGYPKPSYGRNYATPNGTSCTVGFEIAGQSGRFVREDGVLYRATCSVEEYDRANKTYGAARSIDGAYSSDASKSVRLTWSFTPVAYAFAVSDHGVASGLPLSSPYWTDADGTTYYAAGATFSLTANENMGENSEFPFVDWCDGNGKTLTTDKTLSSFTLNAPTTLRARFAWLYGATAKTITDSTGAKFNVTVKNANEGTLAIASLSGTSPDGCYDFSKPIKVAGDDTKHWTITHYGQVFNSGTDVREIILSHETVEIPTKFCNACTSLEKVVMDCPNLTTIGTGDGAFLDCASLKTVIPFLPPSVTKIGNFAFQNAGVMNDLHLTNANMTVGIKAFEMTKCVFADLSGLKNIPESMFGRTNKGNARDYDKKATPLKKVILCAEIEEIGSDAFARSTDLREVYFTGCLPQTYGTSGEGPFGGKSYSVDFHASPQQIGEDVTKITGYSELIDADKPYYTAGKKPLFALNIGSARYIVYKWSSPLDRDFGMVIIIK